MTTDEEKNYVKKKPILCSLAVTACASCLFVMSEGVSAPGELIFAVLVNGLCHIYPHVLTLINLVALFYIPKDIMWRKHLKRFDCNENHPLQDSRVA